MLGAPARSRFSFGQRPLAGALAIACAALGLVACGEGTDEPFRPGEGTETVISRHDGPPVDAAAVSAPVEPVADPVPITGRLRGFNLQGMYKEAWAENNVGYSEADFELLAELGFNMARLPLDYLVYTSHEDWFLVYEDAFRAIDHGISLGQEHGIHIVLNLHGAPGYTAHGEAERFIPDVQDVSLWESEEAAEVFVEHWRIFANRYREIPPEYLSFNLVNEPSGTDEATYMAVMQRAMDAIYEVTPEREVILDGLNYGRNLVEAVADDTTIAQSIHVYDPFSITHYGAGWVGGADAWPEPTWPPTPLSALLMGPVQAERHSPLVIQGEFPVGTVVTFNLAQVSALADLSIRADATEIYREEMLANDDTTKWDAPELNETYGIYQNRCLEDFCVKVSAPLDAPATTLTFESLAGDWLSFTSITIESDTGTLTLTPGITDWGVPQATFTLDAEGRLEPVTLPVGYEDLYDWRSRYAPWVALSASGVHVTVGEFGLYRGVPEDVAAAFLEDHLALFEEAGWDWTMWELAGDFGIFDGARPGATYVPLAGREVDQALLDILQAH